jgi:hypothetical protein
MNPFSWTFRTTDKGTVIGVVHGPGRIGLSEVGISVNGTPVADTEDDGRFEIVLAKGSYVLRFSMNGYHDMTRDVSALSPGQVMDLGIITMSEDLGLATITGRILDKEGEPLLGVIVTADTGETDTSDLDGRFSIEVRPGSRALTFFREGYRNLTREEEVQWGMDMDLGDIVMERSTSGKEGSSGVDILWVQIGIFAALILVGGGIILLMARKKGTGLEEE